jgi:hypothetical protein
MKEISLADSWPGIFQLFFFFWILFAGLLGAGRILRFLLLRPLSRLEAFSDSFLLGSLAYAAIAFALAWLHWLARFPNWMWWAFPTLCLFAGALMEWREKISSFTIRNQRFFEFLPLFVAIFLLRALGAALPSQHGDPLLYHLVGPRQWALAGGFAMDPQFPNGILASTWECLYLWPQMLWFNYLPLYGLVEAQIQSQWLHLFLGLGGCALLVARLFRGAVAERVLPLLMLGALFVSGLQWTATLAKNDLGISLWVLGAAIYFLEGWERKENGKVLLGGIFGGLAVAGKVTALMSLFPFCMALALLQTPWKEPGRFLKFTLLAIVGLALGALPLYLRNFSLTGNPFYPLFANRFPSPWMSPSWQSHFAQVAPSNPFKAFGRIFTRLPDLFHEAPWVLALPLWAVAIRTTARPRLRIALFFLGAAIASYCLFVTTQSTDIELRYLGAALLLISAGSIAALWQVAELWLSPRWQKFFLLFLVIGLLAGSKLPLHIVRKIWKGPLGVAYVSQQHTAGEAKAWLRSHLGDGYAVVVGDNEGYYLSPIAATVLTERPDLDAATRNEKDLGRFVSAICRLAHARYLLDSRPDVGGFSSLFGAAPLAPARVFAAPGPTGAIIFDLRILEARYAGKERDCQ